jgi:hypothetical protein
VVRGGLVETDGALHPYGEPAGFAAERGEVLPPQVDDQLEFGFPVGEGLE